MQEATRTSLSLVAFIKLKDLLSGAVLRIEPEVKLLPLRSLLGKNIRKACPQSIWGLGESPAWSGAFKGPN